MEKSVPSVVELLNAPEGGCFRIYVRCSSQLERDAERAEAAGIPVRRIDGKQCTNTQRLLAHFGAALQFPDWYGNGWDAFDELLRDREFVPRHRCLAIISKPELLLASESDDQFSTLAAILNGLPSGRAASNYFATPQFDYPAFGLCFDYRTKDRHAQRCIEALKGWTVIRGGRDKP